MRLYMLQLASHELLRITRASGASFIGIFSSQKFWLSSHLLLFELRKWFPEKHYGIDAIHFLGHIRHSFEIKVQLCPSIKIGVSSGPEWQGSSIFRPEPIRLAPAYASAQCISHAVQVYLMTVDPLIIQWIVSLTFFLSIFIPFFFFFPAKPLASKITRDD